MHYLLSKLFPSVQSNYLYFLKSYSPFNLFKLRQTAMLSLCLFVVSCAQQSKLEQAQAVIIQGDEKGTTINASTMNDEVAQVAKESFRPETLYALMLAEIALDRDMPDVALGSYRREAIQTRDPKVIQRALEISTWMEVHPVSLELMSLWQEVEPLNPKAYQIMAQQQLYFGRAKSALTPIEKALDLGADFDFDLFNQVVPKLNASDRMEVLRKLEQLRKKFPQNSQVCLSTANLYALLDQRQSALDAAEKAIHLDKQDVRPVVMHAELRFNYHDQQSALKEMEHGLKKFPDSKQLNVLYAQSLLKMGKEKKAEKQITQTLERFEQEPELRFQLALLSAEFDLNTLAKDLFTQGLEDDYRKEETYFHLSRLAENEKAYQAAIQYLQPIKPGVGFLQARLQIAFLLVEQKKINEALASLQEARNLQGENHNVFYHAEADFLIQDGQQEQAMKVFDQAVGEFPDDIKLRYARSMLAESMGNLSLAESDLLKVIEIEPRNAMALNALGYTLANKTNRHQEALAYIEKAYAISPEDPAIIDSMGWVNYRLGNYQEALSFLRKAIAIQADHEIAAHLGEVLWVSGLETEAKQVWTDALDKNQESEALKTVMKRFLK